MNGCEYVRFCVISRVSFHRLCLLAVHQQMNGTAVDGRKGRLISLLLLNMACTCWILFIGCFVAMPSHRANDDIFAVALCVTKAEELPYGVRSVCSDHFSLVGASSSSSSHRARNRVRAFSWKSPRPLAVLRSHDKNVHAVAYSPRIGRLVSGSGDSRVAVWDLFPNEKAKARGGDVRVARVNRGR